MSNQIHVLLQSRVVKGLLICKTLGMTTSAQTTSVPLDLTEMMNLARKPLARKPPLLGISNSDFAFFLLP